MSKIKDAKIAELEQVIANLTAERILPPEPEPEYEYEQEYTCDDCAWPDGQLRSDVSCECGMNDDENTPKGFYHWADEEEYK